MATDRMTHPESAEYPNSVWQDICLIPVGVVWLGLLIVSAVIGVVYMAYRKVWSKLDSHTSTLV